MKYFGTCIQHTELSTFYNYIYFQALDPFDALLKDNNEPSQSGESSDKPTITATVNIDDDDDDHNADGDVTHDDEEEQHTGMWLKRSPNAENHP